MDAWMDRWMNGHMDGQVTNGRMGGQVDEWTDGQFGGCPLQFCPIPDKHLLSRVVLSISEY